MAPRLENSFGGPASVIQRADSAPVDDGSAAEPVLFAMGRSTQITDPDSIARYLRHIGEPVAPPPLTPARGPPYYQSRVLRRRPSPQQTEMFDA